MKLVLLRHGESTWNKENRFTGWTDVDLTEKGVEEARQAGRLLKKEGYSYDLAHTSVLKRAIRTLNFVLEEMDLGWITVLKTWRLNERHYGALQGLNKSEMAKQYGEEQVLKWRRSYDIQPPKLERSDERHPCHDLRYKDLKQDELPSTESLKDTVARIIPYWKKALQPALQDQKQVLVVASGNSLRALVKYLDNIPDDEIVSFNIPTGVPLVYELDVSYKPKKRYFLGDQLEIEKKMQAVANQGKAKK